MRTKTVLAHTAGREPTGTTKTGNTELIDGPRSPSASGLDYDGSASLGPLSGPGALAERCFPGLGVGSVT